MTALQNAFADLVTPGFRDVYFEAYGEEPEQYSKICKVLSTEKYQEKFSSVAGLGAWALKNEGAEVSYENPTQLYDSTMTPAFYSKAFRLSENLWDNDLVGCMKVVPEDMGRGARYVVEQLVANIYNNGFASGLTPDASYVFATNHPVAGSTQANRPTAAVDLSATSLEAAIIAMEGMTDYKGLPIINKAKILLVPPQLKPTALKLVKSTLDPESAYNAINPLASEGLTVVANRFLTDADSWFLIGSQNPVEMYWRKKPTFAQDVHFDTGDLRFKGTMAVGITVRGYQRIYGVPGA